MSTRGPAAASAAGLAEIPEIALVAATTGRFDLVGEAWSSDTDQVVALLDRARSTPGVESIEPIRYLRTIKQDFTGGVL